MNLDASNISVIALVVSIFSLIVALYNSDVDRRIKIEQLKGEMVSRLTSRGIEMLGYIKRLDMQKSEEADELSQNLMKVMEGLVNVRQSLKKSPKPPPFLASAIVPSLQRIRNDIEDAEIVFDKLNEAFADWDLKEIEQITDGLLERFFGSKNSKTRMPNKSLKHDE
jgi:hypothetical protein